MTPNSKRLCACARERVRVCDVVGKCTSHSNSDYPGVIQRKSILACSGGVAARTVQRQSLKDVVRLAFSERSDRRQPPTGSSRTSRREAFIVISRANSSNISKFGPERRVLISPLGWLSVFVYERPLYFFLYLFLPNLLSASFFAILVFSLSMFVSLSLISLLFFLPTSSTRSLLVELLAFSLFLFYTPAILPHTLLKKFSSSLMFQLASGLPNFTIFSCLPPLFLQSLSV